uniref:Uncharacterized protein n=1 Tax=Fagus sylvatica TaxID=28930 RepID=A0A2N9GIS1_FAGSY
MASRKAHIPKTTTKNVGGSTSSSTSTGPMTRNRSKAMGLPTAQRTAGEASTKNLTKALPQPKTVISLDTLGAGRHTSKSMGDMPLVSKDSIARGNSPYSALDAKSSTDSQSGSSPGFEATSFAFSEDSSCVIAMLAMMIETTMVDERIVAMERAISKLTKTVEEKDLQIATLMNKLEVHNHGESSNGPIHQRTPQDGHKRVEDQHTNSTSIASLSVQQLHNMITNTIRAQYGGAPQSTLMYSKPYTKRIDSLRMPPGYQPSKFQQFDVKGNPKQHVTHFVETCNNAGTDGDLLTKQFVRSLRGNAYDWCTDLEPKSIDNWEQMENEFLNSFYNTRCIVSMMELTNTKQWKDEPVVDYINRWRSLSLDCKDRLSEASGVEILASRGEKSLPIAEHRKERKDVKKGDQSSKPMIKESMAITAEPVRIFAKEKKYERMKGLSQERERRRLTLKEMKEKTYPFLDFDVLGMLKDLLEKEVIKLPECKWPKEMVHTNDPKYYKYHRVVSHTVEKCFVLKDLILRLAKEGKILLDLDEAIGSNHATFTFKSPSPTKTQSPLMSTPGASFKRIQFGTFEPICLPCEEEVHLGEAKMIEKEENEIYAVEEVFAQCANCHGKITFTDEDLLLGSKPHNQPLFVSGYVREEKVSRILIDDGSAVNIMSKVTMKRLGIFTEELSKSRLVIQCFNQEGQRVIGIIRLDMIMEDLKTRPLFHVIDSKTSYNLLLGRPWLHENGIIPSTLHQCFKYSKGKQVKKVIANLQPFTEAESHFADAKFYLNCDMVNDVLPEDNKRMREKGKGHGEILCENSRLSVAVAPKSHIASKGASPILRYVPLSERKESQTPFGLVAKAKVRPNELAQEKDIAILKSNLTLPLPKLDKVASTKPLLIRLLAKSGYDFNNPSQLGQLFSDCVEEKSQGLNQTQSKLRQQGYVIETPKTGLGYSLQEPVRISAKGKNERRTALHISFEVVEEESQVESTPRSSVFDCLTSPTPRGRSAFDRLGSPSTSKVASQSKVEKGDTRKKGESEICSLVPSCMKRELAMEVSMGSSLKAKRRTIIHTNWLGKQVDQEEEENETLILTAYHVTVEMDSRSSSSDDEPDETPHAIEDGGQATVDELKELNLGTTDKPHLIFISTLLTPAEEKEYLELLTEYKDVFAWTYKEMSGLDPRVAVHRLGIKQEDEELTAFQTPKGIYCYKVMPFGLKNAGATYQRAMQKIFDDILHKIVQCYVDDLVVKTRKREEHIRDLRIVFNPTEEIPAQDEPFEMCIWCHVRKVPRVYHSTSRLAKWSVAFQEFEIAYVLQKAIKGQALANFLADHPIPTDWELSDDFPDEDVLYTEILPPWMMFFDGAARQVYGDSKLVINQLLTHYEVRNEGLVPYFRLATRLIEEFDGISLEHIPRSENKIADALANLATTLALSEEERVNVPVCNRWALTFTEEYTSETNAISVSVVEDEDWRQPLIDYLEHGKLPNDSRHIRPRYDEGHLASSTIKIPCIDDPLMDYFCDALEREKLIKPWRRPTPESYISKGSKERKCREFHPNPPDLSIWRSSLHHDRTMPTVLLKLSIRHLCNLLKKVVECSKKRLAQENQEKRYRAYRTTYRTPTQATPYSLVYGVEAILPLERQISSLRIAIQEGITNEENARLRLEELEALDEKRLEAQQHLECNQA